MGKQLTSISNKNESKGTLLTNQRVPFRIVIARKLENRYCFTKLEKRNVKEFESFVNKTVGQELTITEVEERFKRNSDTNDCIKIKDIEYDIIHFEVTKKHRIHGYFEGKDFILLRIDPNHKVHN